MDLGKAIAEERTKLYAEKEQLTKRLKEVEKELNAIIAYEKAKGVSAREVARSTAEIVKRQKTKKTKRRTGIRQEVLAVIQKHPDGIARADILTQMNAKGDKQAEQSVSNALAALKKQNLITGEDGTYKPAA